MQYAIIIFKSKVLSADHFAANLILMISEEEEKPKLNKYENNKTIIDSLKYDTHRS